ncbi:hypothetical protein ACH4ND_01315 [Streptomyces sp. NPDC017179]|uniref:hypothetical protein n=1 Tax=Streptomyces sp. NPDC017179 TaxID=3364979 RepID=UPI0037B907F4
MMAQRRNALNELLQQHVGKHTGPDKMSVAQFCAKAIDPDTGYQPSTGLIGKMIRDEPPKVTPELVGAIAVGLGLPRTIVAAAAHLQLIGYEETELKGGAPAALMRRLGVEPGEPERAVAEKWRHNTDQ